MWYSLSYWVCFFVSSLFIIIICWITSFIFSFSLLNTSSLSRSSFVICDNWLLISSALETSFCRRSSLLESSYSSFSLSFSFDLSLHSNLCSLSFFYVSNYLILLSRKFFIEVSFYRIDVSNSLVFPFKVNIWEFNLWISCFFFSV